MNNKSPIKKFEHLYRYCTKDLKNLFFDAQEGTIPCVSPSLLIAVKNTSSIIKRKEKLKSYTDFFNVFKKYFGDQITYHYKGTGGKYTKPENLNWFNKQIENAEKKEPKNNVSFDYECSASALPYGIAQPPAFRSSSYIKMRLDLPVDFLESHSKEHFQKLLHDLFNDYPIEVGYIGYSFLFDYSMLNVLGTYVDWRKLYFENSCFLPYKLFDIPVMYDVPVIVGWITLIGDQHLQQLGGREAAKNFFSKDKEITIYNFKYGIGIQIGKQPIAGTKNEDINLYRKVTQFLLPFRNQRDPYIIFGISQKEYDPKKKEWVNIYPNKGKDEKWKLDNDKWYKHFDK